MSIVDIPTRNQFKIMLFMYNNGKQTSFNKQKIYKDRQSFNNYLNELVKAKWCKKFYFNENYYGLTWEGILIVEEILNEFQKLNNC